MRKGAPTQLALRWFVARFPKRGPARSQARFKGAGEEHFTNKRQITSKQPPVDTAVDFFSGSASEGETCGLVRVVPQNRGAGWVEQLGHRLRLDLSDALAGHTVYLSDLAQGARNTIGQFV